MRTYIAAGLNCRAEELPGLEASVLSLAIETRALREEVALLKKNVSSLKQYRSAEVARIRE